MAKEPPRGRIPLKTRHGYEDDLVVISYALIEAVQCEEIASARDLVRRAIIDSASCIRGHDETPRYRRRDVVLRIYAEEAEFDVSVDPDDLDTLADHILSTELGGTTRPSNTSLVVHALEIRLRSYDLPIESALDPPARARDPITSWLPPASPADALQRADLTHWMKRITSS